MNQEDWYLINRLRANHYNLNESLARKEYIDSPRYDCGAKIQDIHHIASICIKYDEVRNKFYQQLEKTAVPYRYNIDKWLRPSSTVAS